jgi:hypothetical protein
MVHTIWAKQPERDRPFMGAVKSNRVLTFVRNPINKRKDYGQVGFCERPVAVYLVFPRPLSKASEGRVIGIN